MKKYDDIFEFSTGDDNEKYGLYIMELNCALHDDESYLMYYFDEDKFIHRGNIERKTFVAGSRVKLVKDEFGNEYIGKALEKRMLECIKAYREALPDYLVYHKKTEERLKIIE